MISGTLRPIRGAIFCALFAACSNQHPKTERQAPIAAAANPVQSEMRALNDAARDWVTAIANNELDAIEPGIHALHSARSVTEHALEKGAYRPPKNGDKLEQFKRADELFHEQLAKLEAAAKNDDLPAATKQLGVVLEGCTSCHREYRF